MKKVAIITSLIGAYDNKLLNIDYDRSKYDFICFTNNKRLRSKTWDLRIVEPIIPNDYAKSSYVYKWLTKDFIDNDLYDICCWTDSSLYEFNLDKFEEYLNKFIQMENVALYIEQHPSRFYLKDELEANRRLTKDVDERMVKQVERYYREGYKDGFVNLPETGFSFRRFKDPELIKMCELLYDEMKGPNSTKRDQLIFQYACWKTNFKNIKYFTFEQKSEILKFADHPHKPTYTEKVLLCGPFRGDVVFEMLLFQGYCRSLCYEETFDKIVVGTDKDHAFLYQDFVDQIIYLENNGVKDRWLYNGKVPHFEIQNSENKNIKLVRSTEELMYNLLSNFEKQEFVEYNFPEEFKKRYSYLDFEELNEIFRTKDLKNYFRKQINFPLKNEFCFIVVGGKAEKYIERCLTSIKNQTNQNWKCAVVLTETEDKTFEKAKKFESDKITVVKTPKNNFVIKNYLKAIEILKPSDNSILVNVDADDWLIDNDVLTKIDIEYMKNPNLMITCGSWKTFPDYINIPSNCIPYTVDDFKKGIRKVGFRGTHLRTMKYIVFKNIDEKEFKDSITGEIYNVAADVAIMNPALEMVGFENYKFIKDILYVYNRETDFNEDKEKKQQSIDTTIDVSKKEVLNQKNFKKYQEFYLLDESFPHGKTVGNYNFKNFDSLITWNRINSNLPCVFFTDFRLNDVLKYNGKENFALLIEPPVIFPQIYEQIQKINHHFKYVFTFNEDLLKLGQNYKKYLHSSCWIEPRLQKDYEKNKDISIVVSNMRRTINHIFRHEIVDKFKNEIDVFGKAYKYVDNKIESLANYKFQIVVENCDMRYYSTEKIIDCFATKTIPIYGKSNKLLESDFEFDLNGIIRFESIEELNEIIKNIKTGKICYNDKLTAINYNFEKCKEYQVLETWLYKNYFTNEKL